MSNEIFEHISKMDLLKYFDAYCFFHLNLSLIDLKTTDLEHSSLENEQKIHYRSYFSVLK